MRTLAMSAAVVAATTLFLVASSHPAQAAECVCDCSATCPCGENCEEVKICKFVKKCWNPKPCSDEKKIPKCGQPHKGLVCHIPPGNPANAHTLCVGLSAMPAHLAHGDYLGACLKCSDYCVVKKCCKTTTKCSCSPCVGLPDCPPCDCPDHDAGLPGDTSVQFDAGPPATTDANMSDSEAVTDSSAPDGGVPMPSDSEVPGSDAGNDSQPRLLDAGVPDLEVVESDGSCNCPEGFVEEPDERKMEMLGSGGCQMGGGGSLGGVLLTGILFGLAFAIRRTWMTALALAFILVGPSPAAAELPSSLLSPSVGHGDYYQTISPETAGHGKISLGAFYNYEHRPLQILWKDTGERVTSVIKYRHNLDLMMSAGLGSRLEFGLSVPFVLAQGTKGLELLGGPDGESADGGIGDVRISGKLHAWSKGPFSCGIASTFVVPTASDADAFGEGNVAFAPALLAELTSRYVTGAINAGFVVRESNRTLFQEQVISSGTDFTASLGLSVPLWRDRLDFLADTFVSVNLDEQDKEEVPFEALAGLRAHLPNGVSVDVGGGPGLTKGVGTPRFRLFAGISWSPQPETVRTQIVKAECDECDRPVINRPPPVIIDSQIHIKHADVRLSPVYFATDKDEILPQSIPVLQDNLNLLLKHDWIRRVAVTGHADWRASDNYNIALGMARALGVIKLLEAGGVEPSRMIAVSEGENNPQASNKSRAGMAQNRRVEFRIVDPKDGKRSAIMKRHIRVLKGNGK